jgi:NADPH-dependent 2,4-dienoyl-CoA reductase/sulfur reductase-like enzyme/peroxiredoxin family protein/TusA-related sulfurtransferase/rhodanese-related sulfurtransferase
MSKYLIVGGVAGGATTAARLRRNDETAEIVLFEKGAYISYANCGLPYYIGDVITDRDKLFVQTPESFGKRFNLDVRVNAEVISINKEQKTVDVKKTDTGETYTETYDKLILSPGAEAVHPPIPGINEECIFTLRNVHDTDKIKNYINTHQPKKAVVVGAGFIGLEMAENLHHLGIDVTIVELLDQVMPPIDYSMAAIVHQHLKTKQVAFYLGDGVKFFEHREQGVEVNLNSGRKLDVDIVILSIGVRADSKLAKQAGLEIGTTGGIKVNEYLQTSDKDIYALGDAIEYPNPITGKPSVAYLAGPANRQGRICADNLTFGNKVPYKGSIQTAIAKVFDITVASTGVSAKTLQKEGIPFCESITHSGSHAGYYPGAIPLTIKIVFDPKTGKLFGAQAVGYNGVDKRLDLLASVVKQGGTIYDLIDIEHAYAPPYSSAKDPVNIAGYVAENIIEGRMKPIQWNELSHLSHGEYTLIDVRTPMENQLGTIPGAINIPVDDLRNHLNEIPHDKKVIIFCAVGLRGHVASRIMMQNGFDVYNLSGGYKTYELSVMKHSNDDIYENLEVMREDVIEQKIPKPVAAKITLRVDACGLQCPGPIIQLKKSIDKIEPGSSVEIISSDPGFQRDVQAWCNMTNNKLQSLTNQNGTISAIVEKSETEPETISHSCGKGKTFIVFSDDLDKALASFVLANGAAATGQKVTMFFTFWGLNVIKKQQKPSVDKDIFGKMFGMMMPSHSKGLKLSKLNMLGMGSKMMRYIMQKKKIDSLESLMHQAQMSGVEFIACQMSMDVMGVKREELIDNLTEGGVATYLERAEQANLNLFI